MGDGWYVSRAGLVFGPYAWERVLELALDGSIGAEDLVTRPGSSEWVRADAVPAFFARSTPVAATPAAPPLAPASPAPAGAVKPAPPAPPAEAETPADSKKPKRAPREHTRKRTLLLVGVGFAATLGVLTPVLNQTRKIDIPPRPPESKIVTPKIATPPPAEPDAPRSSVPITTPAKGSAKRQQLMDTAHEVLEIRQAFVVEHLFVQGTRAVGIVTPKGSRRRYLLARELMEGTGTWDVICNGAVGAGSRASLEDPGLGLSAEIIDKLGL